MNLQELRLKYRRILEEGSGSASDSEDEAKEAGKVRRSGILTESKENSAKMEGKQNEAIIIALKERVAQGIRNLSKKDEEIAGLKTHIVKHEQHIGLLQTQLAETKDAVAAGERWLVQEKVLVGSLQSDIKTLRKEIQALQMEKELTGKQSEFYRSQTASLKQQKKEISKRLQSADKEMKTVERIRSQNCRLREDIQRMQTIVNECCQGKQTLDLQDKHYLGRPYREANSWFAQNLVGEVELLLKREQVAQGNRQFASNLVKFIDRYCKATKQTEPARQNSSKLAQSRPKSSCKPQSHCNSTSQQEQQLNFKKGHTMGHSILKKSMLIHKYRKLDARRYTEYFPPSDDQPDLSLCEAILQQFRNALAAALLETPLSGRKIQRLCEQLCTSVTQFLHMRST